MKVLGEYLSRENIRKFMKYCLTGGSSFVIEYLLFFLANEVLGLYYVLANAIVYTITFWFSFLVNKYFTFRSKGKMGSQLYRFVLLYAFNMVVTNGMFFLLSDVVGIPPLIGKGFVSGMVVLWNFPIYRRFIYK